MSNPVLDDTTQTIGGDKTFTGLVDLSAANVILPDGLILVRHLKRTTFAAGIAQQVTIPGGVATPTLLVSVDCGTVEVGDEVSVSSYVIADKQGEGGDSLAIVRSEDHNNPAKGLVLFSMGTIDLEERDYARHGYDGQGRLMIWLHDHGRVVRPGPLTLKLIYSSAYSNSVVSPPGAAIRATVHKG